MPRQRHQHPSIARHELPRFSRAPSCHPFNRLQDYGGGLRTLSLCPPTPNCISTAEEANDPSHYVPQW